MMNGKTDCECMYIRNNVHEWTICVVVLNVIEEKTVNEDVILSNELIGQIRKIDGEGYAAIDYYGRIRDYAPTRQEAWNLVCHYEVARKYYKQQSYTQE